MAQNIEKEATRGHQTAKTYKATWHYTYIFVWGFFAYE